MASGSSTKIETLNKENFDTWRIQARAVLIKNKLWSVVEKPLNLEKADEEKREKDLLAQSELVLLISPSELKQIKNCKTAHEIWTLLDFIYASKGPARKASLLKKLILSKMENGNIREHLNKFMDVVDKLQDMDICIHEDLLTVMMLYSLPPDYENFRVAIESRDTLPKPEELKVKILEESESRQFNNGSNTNTTNTKDEHEEETNFVKTCKFCKKKGHIISECRRLENKKKKEMNEEVPKTSHTVCMHSKSKSSDDEKNTWILDSGCTSHMSHNRNYFENLDKSNFQLLRLASQDATADITGKGQVTIMLDANVRGKSKIQEVILKNTLYVPTLSSNLLSISKATESGWTVLFTDKKATITHPEEGIILDAPKGKDGLYYLNPASCKYNNKDKCNLAEDTKIHKWHKCLGHMNEADMKLALKNETLIGLDFKSDEKLGDCEICIQAKIKRLPSKPNDTPRTTKRLEIVHSDVCGPMTQTLGGEKYFITFIDDYTRYSRVYCIKQKSDVLDKFKLYKAEMENFTGDKIISLQSDNGLEYCNQNFDNFLKEHGITKRLTAPYTPHQNGVAERKNRTLLEKARSMMIESKAPQSLWGEAIQTANYLSNRSVNKTISAHFGTVTTPYEKWVQRKPCIFHLRQFGIKAFILLKDGKEHNKFKSKAIPGMFAGYSDTSKAYRIWVPSKHKIIIAKDVRFTNKLYYTEKQNPISEITKSLKDNDKHYAEINFFDDDVESEYESVQENDEQESVQGNDNEEILIPDTDVNDTIIEINPTEEVNNEAPEQRVLRDRSCLRKPQRFDEFVLAATEEFNNYREPSTYREALESTDKEKWLGAMLSEINSLHENQTWDIVPLPKNRKALPCKWVFKVKTNPDGSVERYKARLVVKGFSQKPGVDYDKTFSPVVRLTTVRTLLAVAVKEKLSLCQFDVSTAFLNGNVEEEIYMKQPDGYSDGTNRVCRLKRSLYGLKQAPRCWNTSIHEFLVSSNFTQSTSDPCLYIRENGKSKVLIALYVDDGLVASTTEDDGKKFIKELQNRFKIVTKPASYFLGMEIERSDNGNITLSQKAYTKKVLEKYKMSECKPIKTPITKEAAKIENASDEKESSLIFPYRQAVGSLAYLMVGTRPDINFAVSCASRNFDNPSRADILAVKRILRYLKGTMNKSLVFGSSNNAHNKLICYSDADFSAAHSTSGILCLYYGPISWRSNKQKTIALSSTEAELVAASETAREIIWLQQMLEEITKTEKPPLLYIDNESTIKLAYNPPYEQHSRTKHIQRRYLYVRECVAAGILEVKQVTTEDQLADCFTKPLYAPRLEKLTKALGLSS